MQVIKRSGHSVDYDRNKIITAINKANREVPLKEQASFEDIREICHYIESLNKKRMLVEDIQDEIEIKLMELEKYKLAKQYIVYRYTRMLIRKSNTTDESILSLIKNNNDELTSNELLASKQRNFIASEVSRDLTKRVLLPERIQNAHEKGEIYFHDMEYFIQPIINSSLINIADMLDNGTKLNKVEITPPKSFHTATIITSKIISNILENQYGGVSIDISSLSKYLRKSKDNYKKSLTKKYLLDKKNIDELIEDKLNEELTKGIQSLLYELSTTPLSKNNSSLITLFLNIDIKDKYIKETILIIKEILSQRLNETDLTMFPKLVYVLNDTNNFSGGKYDYLTELTIKCIKNNDNIEYLSSKVMKSYFDNNIFSPIGTNSLLSLYEYLNKFVFEGRFNQGIVTINLPQVGIISDGNEEKFWDLLDSRIELCYEALMCRHHSLLGTSSKISPLHWQYGGISRLKEDNKIDEYLKNGYSTISLGYIGLSELTLIMKNTNIYEEKGLDFAKKVLKYMKEKCDFYTKQNKIKFVLYATNNDNICKYLLKKDLEHFGTIENITDKEQYNNSFETNSSLTNIYQIIDYESVLQKFTLGGSIININMPENKVNKNIIQYIYDKSLYVFINCKK